MNEWKWINACRIKRNDPWQTIVMRKDLRERKGVNISMSHRRRCGVDAWGESGRETQERCSSGMISCKVISIVHRPVAVEWSCPLPRCWTERCGESSTCEGTVEALKILLVISQRVFTHIIYDLFILIYLRPMYTFHTSHSQDADGNGCIAMQMMRFTQPSNPHHFQQTPTICTGVSSSGVVLYSKKGQC